MNKVIALGILVTALGTGRSPASDSPSAPVTSGNWSHTQLTVNGKSFSSIFSVRLVDKATVEILDSEGGASAAIDKLPDGFLKSWGITPEAIDKKVSQLEEQSKEASRQQEAANALQAEANKKRDQAEREKETDESETTLGCKVSQVINDREIIGTVTTGEGDIEMFHISDIDARGLVDGQMITEKVWPDGIYRYTTVLGAAAQIKSFTGSRAVALAAP